MIFVTGASGRLGSVVFKRVGGTPLLRRTCGLKNEIVTDFEVESLRRILKSAKAVLHIAGSVDFNDKKALWNGNVKLTENIVNATPDDAKIVFASSIAVYGKNPPYMTDENTPINPDNEYAKTKAIAEEIIRSHRNHVILRIGTIYGSMFSDYIKMISMLSKGVVPIIGSGENRIPFVHVEDVAECFYSALKKDIRGIYIVCGRSEKQRDIMLYTAKLLRKRFVTLKLPTKIVMLLAKPLGLSEHVKVLVSDRVFNFSKAVRDLDFRPRDVWSGIEEIVRFWRNGYEGKG